MENGWQRKLDRRTFIKLLAAAGAATVLNPLRTVSAAPGTGQALMVSDIHFDPFSDTRLVSDLIASPASQWNSIFASSQNKRLNCYGQETNFNLLDYGLRSMKAACPAPDCVIYTGDLPCHGIWQKFAAFNSDQKLRDQFIHKLVEFMGLRFRSMYPNAPVYFCLGNNDSFCQDYKITPRGDYLHSTAPTYHQAFLKSPQPSASFFQDYQSLGCYSLPGPIPGLRIMAINSNYMSVHWSCECCPDSPGDPAAEQLEWLEAQLSQAAANGEAVWLMMHIPPGINAFNTVKMVDAQGKLQSVRLDLVEEYNARLLSIMRKYAGILRASFAGHTHMDHFRAIPLGQSPAAMQRITPALNSLFGGNPAYQVLRFSRSDFVPQDLVTYYLNLDDSLELPGPGEGDGGEEVQYPPWRWEYAFASTYGTKDLGPESLLALSRAMRTDRGLREKFRSFYNASREHAPGFSEAQAKVYWCALAHLEPQDYIDTFNSVDLTGLPISSSSIAA
jgi:sphingomyelin phosphodiesterase acid-like 3